MSAEVTSNAGRAKLNPMATAKPLRGVVMLLALKTGRPPPELMTELGLAPDALQDPDGRVPHSVLDNALRVAEAVSGDMHFGLSVAELVDGAPSDFLDYALLYMPTVGHVADSFLRYQRLIHDAAASFKDERGVNTALVLALSGVSFESRHLPAFILSTWLRRLRRTTAVHICPVAVRFRAAAPADPERYARTFEAPVSFGAGEDALEFERSVFDLPCVQRDEALRTAFEAHVLKQLSTRNAPSDEERWMSVFRSRLTETVVRSTPTVDQVAQLLHASPRTLQRRLRDNGTSFQAQLDEVRRELATARLREPAASVTDVAFLLGFSDLSAFTRAFRRWTGKTPARFLREGVSP